MIRITPLAATPADAKRLRSLDVLRGLTVVGMILVNSAAVMKFGAKADVYPFLLHSHWQGLTLADLVFPAFLTMVGVSVPFSLKPVAGEPIVSRILWRGVRLFLLGCALSNLQAFADFHAEPWRFFGVLQRIGLVYVACALLYLKTSPRMRALAATLFLLGYWPLAMLPSLDGLPTDLSLRGHNFVASADRVLLGSHRYVQGLDGFDPEGILGTLPAIAQGLIGIAIGEQLRSRRQDIVRRLLLMGASMIGIGLVWSSVFPIIKDIWSSTFVLVTAGTVAIVLAGLHKVLDERDDSRSRFQQPIMSFGTNAIAAYTFHQVTARMVQWDLMLYSYQRLRLFIGEPLASLMPIAQYMLFLWLAMDALRRKGWILKI